MMPGHCRGTWIHYWCLWLAACASPYAWPQAEQTIHYPLKLAFIYNVTKFVEWPPAAFSSPSAPVVICIMGHDPFPEDAERELRSRTSGGRPVEIRKLAIADDPGVCHVVFICDSELKNTTRILTRAENTIALTIGESQGFGAQGGVVNLVIHDANVHFEINTGAAERKHLIISSRLLALARIVRTSESAPQR
jgi:hypothetical protein